MPGKLSVLEAEVKKFRQSSFSFAVQKEQQDRLSDNLAGHSLDCTKFQ
jgi:hypothetical protein